MHIFLEQTASSKKIDPALMSVIECILQGVALLSQKIYTADVGLAGSKNIYGEEQLRLDLLAHRLYEDSFKQCDAVGIIASEELNGEHKIGNGQYAVCMDPLDGSSLVDVNFSVGSIFAVYKTDTFLGLTGRSQLAVLFAVFGPRTTVMMSIGHGVFECTLGQDDTFIVSRENIMVTEQTSYFAPGNLRACLSHPGYRKLLNYWFDHKYTLRYSGGMVPDINHILSKGQGIFTYPGYPDAPEGKLRLLFECAPMAFLMEQAGGFASDGTTPILDKVISDISLRTPILIGSRQDVELAEDMLKG